MAQSEARAWWADVQHLRDAAERTDEARRRADQADLAARRAIRERGHVEAEVAVPRRRAEDNAPPRRRAEDNARARPRTEDNARARRRAEDNAQARCRAEDNARTRVRAEDNAQAPRRADDSATPRWRTDDNAQAPRRAENSATPRHATENDIAPHRGAEDVAARRGDHADGAGHAPRLREYPRDGAMPARRTVEIRGRTVPAPTVPRVEIDRRRPPRRAIERIGPRPDRMAMWALLMGLLLILVALGTADAGTLSGR
jgi:hypothetical protein